MRLFPALEIHFTPEAEAASELPDRLFAALDDFRPTAIEESATAWRVFFDSPASRDGALAWLRRFGDPRIAAGPLDVEDEDWARRSQADLEPVRVGRIVITPPWRLEQARDLAQAGDVTIIVVPSTGFGTGHHASTRLCLAMLQEIAVNGRTALDIGTGSGVLAIAAARLGARSIVAVDIDADAIEAARENVALNKVTAFVRLECADFRGLSAGTAHIVIANLTGDLLRRSARDIVLRADVAGHIILSGVLTEEQAPVAAAFEAAGAKLRATKSEDEWVALRFAN